MKRTNQGISLIETLTATVLFAIVAGGFAMLLIGMCRSYNYTNTQLYADVQTSQAVQQMARDLQEAKLVTINSPTSMTVYYPVKNVSGIYTGALDNTNTLSFYLADSNGPNPAGTLLVRKSATAAARTICKGINSLSFVSPNPTSVDVTVDAQQQNGSVIKACNMVHRAIFLRNY